MKDLFSIALAVSLTGLFPALAGPPHAQAIYSSQPVAVDGKLNEPAWAQAQPIFYPAGKNLQNGGTEARFLWTQSGVYVAFETLERTPIFGHFAAGQPLYQEDVFELFIDQKGDHRQWYELQINPVGQLFLKNYVFTAPPRLTPQGRLAQEYCDSEMWRYEMPIPPGLKATSVLNRQTHRWTVEIFLPAEMVNRRRGGAPMVPCTWRINLVRHDWTQPPEVTTRSSNFMYWAPVLPGHPHLSPKLMGYLTLRK